MRAILGLIAVASLAACAPEIPDSAIGFDNSADAQRARELALTGGGGAIVPPPVISDERLPPAEPFSVSPAPQTAGSTTSASSADIAAETAAALLATGANSGVPPLNAGASNPAPAVRSNPGISNENDFAAVSSERSIQGDAQRIEQNRQQYQVVQPTALPSRNGTSDPNIVNYALQTTHARGTRLYTRTGINLAARAQRVCAGYASADQAQIDFLAKGGPERDRLGVDPDGDGFACAWNPAPFRAAVRN
jgi:hypothetical protein